jgi:hypothetical protein
MFEVKRAKAPADSPCILIDLITKSEICEFADRILRQNMQDVDESYGNQVMYTAAAQALFNEIVDNLERSFVNLDYTIEGSHD